MPSVAEVKAKIDERRPGTHRSPQYAAALAKIDTLEAKLSAVTAELKTVADERDELGQQRDAHALEHPHCGTDQTVMPCPGCGAVDISDGTHGIFCFQESD